MSEIPHYWAIIENSTREIPYEERTLIMKLLQDFNEPQEVDAAFAFGRALGDEKGPLAKTAEIYYLGMAPKIVITGTHGQGFSNTRSESLNRYFNNIGKSEAWPGRTIWVNKLTRYLNINRNDIAYLNPAFHTKDEAESLLQFVRSHYLNSVVIVTQPHQMERAFLSIVAAMRDRKHWFRLYSAVPDHVDWNEVVPGSQGLGPKPRKLDVDQELKRVLGYAPKDVATIEEGLNYLRTRGTLP